MPPEPIRPGQGAVKPRSSADHAPRITAEDPVQEEVIEELRHNSPEGSPPHRAERRVSTGVLILVGLLVLATIIGLTTAIGGWGAGLLAAGFVLVAYLLAGGPILYASRLRAIEERATREIVTGEDQLPRAPRI